MLTNDELQAIRARAEAATPGPWTIIPAEPEIDDDDDGRVIEGAYSYPGGVEDANGDAVCTFGSEYGSGHMFESEDNKIAISQARTDIPALLEHIEHLQRIYTIPCPYCDFSSGQRGMDRCPHCDGTGRMAMHRFVAQQRDAARAEVEGLKAVLERAWYVLDSAAAGVAPKVAAAMARANVEKFIGKRESNFDDATKEAASE